MGREQPFSVAAFCARIYTLQLLLRSHSYMRARVSGRIASEDVFVCFFFFLWDFDRYYDDAGPLFLFSAAKLVSIDLFVLCLCES